MWKCEERWYIKIESHFSICYCSCITFSINQRRKIEIDSLAVSLQTLQKCILLSLKNIIPEYLIMKLITSKIIYRIPKKHLLLEPPGKCENATSSSSKIFSQKLQCRKKGSVFSDIATSLINACESTHMEFHHCGNIVIHI